MTRSIPSPSPRYAKLSLFYHIPADPSTPVGLFGQTASSETTHSPEPDRPVSQPEGGASLMQSLVAGWQNLIDNFGEGRS